MNCRSCRVRGQKSKLSSRHAELGAVKEKTNKQKKKQECSGLLTVLFIFFVLRKEKREKLIPLFSFSLRGSGYGWRIGPQQACASKYLCPILGSSGEEHSSSGSRAELLGIRMCWACNLVIWLQVVSWWASWGYQTVTVSGMKDANIFLFILFMGFSRQDYWSCLPSLDESGRGKWKSWLKTQHSKI